MNLIGLFGGSKIEARVMRGRLAGITVCGARKSGYVRTFSEKSGQCLTGGQKVSILQD
jgi:hypothetical protein